VVWYKVWVESRLRFLVAVLATFAICAGALLLRDAVSEFLARRSTAPETFAAYVLRVPYGGAARFLFLTFAIVLGLGGLRRERELGTAPFTLALPIGRARLTVARAAAGIAEVVAVAATPALVILALSPFIDHRYPASQALEFALMWRAGGAVLFGVAFLASTLFSGEYTAFVVAHIVLLVHTVSTQFMRIARPAAWQYLRTLQEVMSGMHMSYFDPAQNLFIGPLPLLPIAILSALTAMLVAAAVAITIRQDF